MLLPPSAAVCTASGFTTVTGTLHSSRMQIILRQATVSRGTVRVPTYGWQRNIVVPGGRAFPVTTSRQMVLA